MKILHITDYHYDPSAKYLFDQQNYLKKILDSAKKSGPFDFVIFSGDLVYSGKDPKDFASAKEDLILTTLKEVNVGLHNFFIAQGNHDVDWSKADEVIDFFISEKISDNQSLDRFVSNIQSDKFKQSFAISENYFTFIQDLFGEQERVKGGEIHPLYTAQIRKHQDKKIGFVTTNSAWRSTKYDHQEGERGHLMVPISILKTALNHVKECDIRILIQHHPLSFLKDWNQWEFQTEVFNHFDLFFTGHEHRPAQGIQLTANDGIITIAGSAALAYGKAKIGCTIVDLDWDEGEYSIELHQYDPDHDKVWTPAKKQGDIPMDQEKKRANRLRVIIRDRLAREKEKANALFVSFEEGGAKDFQSIFSDPVISALSPVEFHTSGRNKKKVSIEEILKSPEHAILFGSDKSGKTSILMKTQLDILEQYTELDTIPYLFNATEVEKNPSPFDIQKKLKSRLGLTSKRTQDILASKKLILLVDDFHPNQSRSDDAIRQVLNKFPGTKVIFAASYSHSTLCQAFKLQGKPVKSFYIQEISKHHLRTLTNKWLKIPEERQENIIKKIHGLTKQLSIPFNYWSVSLFLWVFEKTHENNIHNNINIIDLYVEHLIDKNHLSRDRKAPFDYEKYRVFLSHLAAWLLMNHESTNYSTTYVKVLNFTENYLSKNPRNTAKPEHVLNYVVSKGILREGENGNFSFRLTGVFEFFLANYMAINEDFRNKVLNSDEWYLSFTNELEFYAGLNPSDENLLDQVFTRTQIAFESSFKKYLPAEENVTIDGVLQSKIKKVLDLSAVTNIAQSSSPLSPDEADQLKDRLLGEGIWQDPEAELVKKEMLAWEEASTDNLETYLFSLCRVFRNLDDIHDRNMIHEVLDYIIDATCILGFSFIEDTERDLGEDLNDKKHLSNMVNFLANFTPIITQTMLNDALNHFSFKRLFIEKIEELNKERKKNQYKLFLLHFLLVDLNPANQTQFIEDVIEKVTLPTLRSANLMKLYIYKFFNCHKKPDFEKFINKKIFEQAKKINPQLDPGPLQKKLAKDIRNLHPDSQ